MMMQDGEVRRTEVVVEDLLLTIPEACRRSQIGRTKLLELAGTGEIKIVRVGRARRVVAASLASWVQRLAEQQPSGRALP